KDKFARAEKGGLDPFGVERTVVCSLGQDGKITYQLISANGNDPLAVSFALEPDIRDNYGETTGTSVHLPDRHSAIDATVVDGTISKKEAPQIIADER